MSAETTNKKIKIDNGTTFGRTYTDKAVDERLQGLVSTATFTPVKEKANNSLQKPAGLTKTKLVGVGTNGQENIEIGDNLTLANGKLSATGGGSGVLEYNVLFSSDYMTYEGEIDIDKINLLVIDNIGYIVTMLSTQGRNEGAIVIFEYPMIQYLYLHDGEITITVFNLQYLYHFITLTNSTSTFYLTYQNTSYEKIITLDSLKTALAGKSLICTGHTSSETAEYISGKGDNIIVGVVNKSDNSTSGITIDSSFTITDLVKPVE